MSWPIELEAASRSEAGLSCEVRDEGGLRADLEAEPDGVKRSTRKGKPSVFSYWFKESAK